ncbi:hypothetical protein G7Y79_00009g026280 [Physcia stellaris]|nr:hypothetical protein G7Y79_00009g026280 [Physcia stellaris]
MAPRRGGGGYSSSSDSDSEPSIWTEPTILFGTEFHNSYRVALVAIQAIFLFALIVVAIASMSFKKRSPSSQALFRWYRYGLAMIMTLVFFAFSLIQLILEEKETMVATVFYLISMIIEQSIYPAEIFLLLTVFAVISQLNKRVMPMNILTKASFAWMYGVFCAILFTLFLAILALRIQYSVEATLDGEYSYLFFGDIHSSDHLENILLNAAKITIAYNVLYMVASLGALALAGWTLVRSLKEQDGKQKLMGILLVALVAFPLFLRSIIEVGFVATYSLNFYLDETPSGLVAETFMYYLCTVLVFAGVVAIGFHLAKDVPEHEQIMYGPQAGGMNYFANGPQGYMHDWNKQAQVTQQPAPIYYAQNNPQNGAAPVHHCPTCGDSRATVQPVSPVHPVSPVVSGHGAVQGGNGFKTIGKPLNGVPDIAIELEPGFEYAEDK